MSWKTATTALTGLLAGAMLLTGCAPSSVDNGEGSTQEFRIIATEPSAGLDPATAVTQASLRVMELLYDTLIDYDEDNTLVPMIAEKWEVSDDGLTYVFTIRENAAFSDGSAITTSDVVYSIERAINNEAMGSRLAGVDSVEATGASDVTVTLSSPSRVLLNALATGGSAAILKQEAVEAGADYFAKPVATSGPWTLEENVQQSHATMLKNEHYWNAGFPVFDKITYTYSTDTTAMAAAVETNTADMTYNMTPADAVRLESSGAIQFFAAPSPGILSWGLDKSQAPFDDVRVRQAVAYLAPRADRLETCWNGIGPVSYGDLIYKGQDFASTGDERFNVSKDEALKKANNLLAEAGWVAGADGILEKNGQRFSVEVPYENTWAQARCNTEMLQQYVKPAGIEAIPVAYDRSSFWTDVAADKFRMYHAGNNYATVDAYFEQTFACEGSANVLIAKWCNEEADSLIKEALQTSDLGEVTNLYRQVQDIILDEQPTITTGAQYAVIGTSPKLEGYYARADASNRALIYSTLSD